MSHEDELRFSAFLMNYEQENEQAYITSSYGRVNNGLKVNTSACTYDRTEKGKLFPFPYKPLKQGKYRYFFDYCDGNTAYYGVNGKVNKLACTDDDTEDGSTVENP